MLRWNNGSGSKDLTFLNAWELHVISHVNPSIPDRSHTLGTQNGTLITRVTIPTYWEQPLS